MAFVAVPNTARVSIEQRLFGQLVVNVLWFRYTSAPDALAMQDLANGVGAWAQSSFLAGRSSLLSLVQVIAKNYTVEDGGEYTYAPTGTYSGNDGNPATPSNTAACITFKTGFSGRSYRGRNYLAGLTQTSCVNNVVQPAFRTGMLDAYTELKTGLFSLGWEHVVVSFRNNKVARPVGVATPVQTYVFNDVYSDSQRRRLTGRGA